MATTLDYKCPHCGGKLEFQPGTEQMQCPYCDSVVDVAALQNLDEVLKNTPADEMHYHEDAGAEWSQDEQAAMQVYVCKSCGGEIISDENTAATACPFCGNPVVLSGRLSGVLKPDYVIPFQLDKKAAKDALKKHLEGKRLLPKVFKSEHHIDEIKGIYVPFWLLDCAVNTDLFGTGKRVGKDTVSKISVRAKANYYVKGVPFDASRKIANKLMEAIEPFDYSEMVKFENRFLQGFYADKYDQDPFGMLDRFIKRLDRISMGLNDNISAKYDGYDPSPEKNFTWMSEVNIKYCLLPVWFMTVEFDGDIYQFAVNGQTGEASGQAPTSGAVDKMDSFLSFTRSNWKWIPVTVAAILPVVIFLITLSGNTSPFIFFLFLTICILETLLIIFSVMIFVLNNIGSSISDRIHRKADASNDFDKAPGLDAYLDTKHLTKLSVDEYIFRLELDEDDIDVPFVDLAAGYIG